METRAGVVVPIRAFNDAKHRLAPRLDDAARAALARRLADAVVAAAAPLPVVVVSSAPEVRDWAGSVQASVIDDPGSLDGAAHAGREWFRARGATRIVVAHADLPHARDLAPLALDGAQPIVCLVPDHRDDGTPVCSVPAAADFAFAYGPGSFRRHLAAARTAGTAVRVLRAPGLRLDIDFPADLEEIGG